MKSPESGSGFKRADWSYLWQFIMPVAGFLCVWEGALAAPGPPQGELLATNGTVQFTNPRSNWIPAAVGQKLQVEDRLRTLALSRATVRLAELGRLRINELTTLEI